MGHAGGGLEWVVSGADYRGSQPWNGLDAVDGSVHNNKSMVRHLQGGWRMEATERVLSQGPGSPC